MPAISRLHLISTIGILPVISKLHISTIGTMTQIYKMPVISKLQILSTIDTMIQIYKMPVISKLHIISKGARQLVRVSTKIKKIGEFYQKKSNLDQLTGSLAYYMRFTYYGHLVNLYHCDNSNCYMKLTYYGHLVNLFY